MMLPILISVSVAPVSYFFCATADAVAAAMISPERTSVLARTLMKFVVKRSLSARFMSFLLPVRVKRDGFLSDSFLSAFFWSGPEDSSRTRLPKAAGNPMNC